MLQNMIIKYTQKIKILTAILVMTSSLVPAISHASFFDWLGGYGTEPMSYSNSVISQGGLLYANAGFNQKDAGNQNDLTTAIQGVTLIQPSSLLTVVVPSSEKSSAKKTLKVRLTAYSSTPDQTDGDPFTTANGTQVRDGIVAANFLPFNTLIKIPELYGDKVFVVTDRMNARFQHNVDIWFPDRVTAMKFGSKTASIVIVGSL